jgi:hypothetical protein
MSLKMQRNPSPGHDFPREIPVSAAGSSPIAGSPSIQNPADSSRTKKWREGTARHLLPTIEPKSQPVSTSSARSHSWLLIRTSSRIEVIRRVRDRRPLAANRTSPPRSRFSWTYVDNLFMWSEAH